MNNDKWFNVTRWTWEAIIDRYFNIEEYVLSQLSHIFARIPFQMVISDTKMAMRMYSHFGEPLHRSNEEIMYKVFSSIDSKDEFDILKFLRK